MAPWQTSPCATVTLSATATSTQILTILFRRTTRTTEVNNINNIIGKAPILFLNYRFFKSRWSSSNDYVTNGMIPIWHKKEKFPKWHKFFATVALKKSQSNFFVTMWEKLSSCQFKCFITFYLEKIVPSCFQFFRQICRLTFLWKQLIPILFAFFRS